MPATPESANRSMARNTVLRAVTEILVKLGSLVLFAALARTVGQSTFGAYSFALAITQVVYAFAGLGLDRMTVRDIARDPAAIGRVFWEAMAIKVAGVAAGVSCSCAALAFLGYAPTVLGLVAVLGASVALSLVTTSSYAVFQAHERMQFFVLTAIPTGALNVVLGLAALALGLGVFGVATASLVTAAFSAVLSFAVVRRRFGDPPVSVDPRRWPAMIREAAPFGIQEILGQIIFRFDTLLLGLLAASAVVGSYSAAYRLLEASLFIAWSIGGSVLPLFSYLPSERDVAAPATASRLERVYAAALELVLAMMVPIAVVLFVCADDVIDVIYGDEYADAAALLRILSIALVLYGVGHIAGVLVLVRRSPRVSISYNGGAALLNVVACFALIPMFGARGAAIATLIGEGALAVLGLVLAARVARVPAPQRWLLGPGAAAVAMALAMAPLRDDVWLAAPVGVVVYALVLGLLVGRRLLTEVRGLRTAAATEPR